MSRKYDVACKILGGRRLSLAEFRLAIKDGMLGGGMPQSDAELARDYLYWDSGNYEDDDRWARLCDKHPTGVIEIKKDGGKIHCGMGIHMDGVNPDKLTPQNIKFLRHHFGKAKVRELTGK